jgi:hypothetical protein
MIFKRENPLPLMKKSPRVQSLMLPMRQHFFTSTAPLPIMGGGFATSGYPDCAFSVRDIQF